MEQGAAQPLLVILGPTASGKSRLALALAEALGGEIVSADAFAVYRGLDIGTDKPSAADRRRVRHHLLDVADPREVFSAGAFARAARAAIADIAARGLQPLVAGGTNFWIRALLEGLFDAPPRDPEVTSALAAGWRADPAAMARRLAAVDPESAGRIGAGDRQRILRALEVFELTGEPLSLHWKRQQTVSLYDPLLVAPARDRAALYARIDARVERIFEAGLVGEVEALLAAGVPPGAHALKAIGYREVVGMVQGGSGLEAAIESTKRASRNFAKRQLTWLRGMASDRLHWVRPVEDGGAAAVIELWTRHHGGGRRGP
ncbi:MAG: tRNA (adenosine(37)-N6)-dimethylallyltransferase MiaA [Thermoanaerobaculales bacterium]|nr:tRNA (adenosine(37)-N6)-dimethylallyltransferase MiaA [Thermoanaerobaculales bacterium]